MLGVDLAALSAATSSDRGVIDQILIRLGVSSSTAHMVQVWAIGPVKVAVVLVIAFVLTRLERHFAHRLVSAVRLVSPLRRATARGTERAETITGAVSTVFRAVIWVIAWLTVFSELGIKLTPFVAGATVIGAALGFGAQTLVKDFLSGLLILAEDQYEVGDNIVVGSTSGTVEGVSLRVTRIRAIDGVVWYVPNGDIRTVGNNSEGDSVAVVEIVVPLGTDLLEAGRVAEQEARAMAEDPQWASCIVGQPTFAGVASVAADGATMRVSARTAPGQHQRVGRELRLRILERLRSDGLAWAASPAAVSVSDGSDVSASADGDPAVPSTTASAPAPPGPRTNGDSPPTPRSHAVAPDDLTVEDPTVEGAVTDADPPRSATTMVRALRRLARLDKPGSLPDGPEQRP